MGDIHDSTLPHVLKEYNPDYEAKRSTHRCETEKKSPVPARSSKSPPKSPPHSRIDSFRERSPPARSKSPTQSVQSLRKRGKTDAERFEDLSRKWDQAKEEVRLEDHEYLKERITLQEQLIKRQDELADQRRLQREEELIQHKDAEKAKKQARDKNFQEICKKSLEEDRRSGKSSRSEKSRDSQQSKQSYVSDTGGGRGSSGPLSPHKSPSSPTKKGAFKMTLPTVSRTPSDMQREELSGVEKEPTNLEDLPWHEQQLIKMYGSNANYFLHPKIEPTQKPVNQQLRREGGRSGASVLWKILREQSTSRLIQEDLLIPQDLKDTYSAFARQSLQMNKKPVKRMYYAKDDLPEMDRLLDNHKLEDTHNRKHRTEIMYRASVSNQDRTHILSFNNPMPDFNEGQVEGSVSQYLPSWLDEGSEVSEKEYMKWIHRRLFDSSDAIPEDEEHDPNKENRKPQDSLDQDMILFMARKRPTGTKTRYVFLQDDKYKGKFSEKFKEDRDYKDLPKPYKGAKPEVKSYSSMGMAEVTSPQSPTRRSEHSGSYSAPIPSKHQMLSEYTSEWEPLSMNALVEYKKRVDAMGEGDFNLGRTKMWTTINAV